MNNLSSKESEDYFNKNIVITYENHNGDEKNALKSFLDIVKNFNDEMVVVSTQRIDDFAFIYRVIGKSMMEDESRLVQSFDGFTVRTLGEIRKIMDGDNVNIIDDKQALVENLQSIIDWSKTPDTMRIVFNDGLIVWVNNSSIAWGKQD